jgi:hypothetical protein
VKILLCGYPIEINEDDYEKYILNSDRKWAAYIQHGNQVYFVRTNCRNNIKKSERLHRLIANATRGVVDHADGNTLNLKKENLRVCSRQENARNRKVGKNNSTGLKGVSFKKDAGKYWARIWINGKNKSLGFFLNPEDAHAAYCNAAIKYYGDYARFA